MKKAVKQYIAIGLLILSMLWNLVQAAWIGSLEAACQEMREQLVQAELARDRALEQMEELAREMARDWQAQVVRTVAYESVETYQYIGECTVTAYCPCETCCGQWADGLTATGIPAEQGIVAVDPEVIPLGSTVVINGQEYLAADTGVKGQAIDICMADHQAAVEFGVQMAVVWLTQAETAEGEHHG